MTTIIDQLVFFAMRQSFPDYSISVITDRALPDVRDKLKPVHRHILYAMDQMGNTHNKAYKKSVRIVIALLATLLLPIAAAGVHAAVDPARCVVSAAKHHSVNPSVLRAILAIESGTRADVINHNRNGSVDVGIAGINSIHFKDLARFGITPEKLMDPCVSTYVAAWKLSRHMARFGNNWHGVAVYHSKTPYFNARYQILLHNQLIRQGAIVGKKMRVPPLRRNLQ